jgi:hypothetical protein
MQGGMDAVATDSEGEPILDPETGKPFTVFEHQQEEVRRITSKMSRRKSTAQRFGDMVQHGRLDLEGFAKAMDMPDLPEDLKLSEKQVERAFNALKSGEMSPEELGNKIGGFSLGDMGGPAGAGGAGGDGQAMFSRGTESDPLIVRMAGTDKVKKEEVAAEATGRSNFAQGPSAGFGQMFLSSTDKRADGVTRKLEGALETPGAAAQQTVMSRTVEASKVIREKRDEAGPSEGGGGNQQVAEVTISPSQKNPIPVVLINTTDPLMSPVIS